MMPMEAMNDRCCSEDDAARKLLFLALRNIAKKWTMPHRYWRPAANQFTIMFGERFTRPDTHL